MNDRSAPHAGQVAIQRALAQVSMAVAVLSLVVAVGSLVLLPHAAALGQWIVVTVGALLSATAFTFGLMVSLRKPAARLTGIAVVVVALPVAAFFGLLAFVVPESRWILGAWALGLLGYGAWVSQRLVRRPTGGLWEQPKSQLGIFISYRRQDSRETVGRIYDHLQRAFEEEHLFLDVDRQAAGQDYRLAIVRALERADVLLAVIGTDWVRVTDGAGRRRLDDPEDMVRIELETALVRDALIIPVLVEGAGMPRPEDVPPSLRPLCYRTAVSVRPDPDFSPDMQRLIAALRVDQRGGRPAVDAADVVDGLRT